MTAAVGEMLGTARPLKYEVNPGLVCGSRLRIGGRVWDATVAGYLDEATAALKGEGNGRPG